MNKEHIETFLTILDTKNISMAAKKLFVSQSTVSHRLNALENELGFNLLLRARGERFISLTLKGEEFVEIAKRWRALWNETTIWKDQEPNMNLKLSGVDSLNICVFSSLYKNLIKNKNSLSIDISSRWSKTIYDLIENYDVDMGFVLSPLEYPNVIVKPLFSARGVVISLKSSEYSEIVHPSDLNPSNEILFSYISQYKIWRSLWWDIDKKEYSSVDTVALLFSILDSEKQWAIVPIWIARTFEKIHPIKISELSVSPPEYSCYQILNRHPRPSRLKSIETFSDALETFMKGDKFLDMIK